MHTVVLRGKVLLKGLEKSIQMGGAGKRGRLRLRDKEGERARK